MRFRFFIRDLLWLTLVVGLIVGWLVDRRSIQRSLQRQSAIEFNAMRKDFAGVVNRFSKPILTYEWYQFPIVPPEKAVP